MAADHYLNKVFIYILPVKTTIPHQPFPAPFTKSSTRGRRADALLFSFIISVIP